MHAARLLPYSTLLLLLFTHTQSSDVNSLAPPTPTSQQSTVNNGKMKKKRRQGEPVRAPNPTKTTESTQNVTAPGVMSDYPVYDMDNFVDPPFRNFAKRQSRRQQQAMAARGGEPEPGMPYNRGIPLNQGVRQGNMGMSQYPDYTPKKSASRWDNLPLSRTPTLGRTPARSGFAAGYAAALGGLPLAPSTDRQNRQKGRNNGGVRENPITNFANAFLAATAPQPDEEEVISYGRGPAVNYGGIPYERAAVDHYPPMPMAPMSPMGPIAPMSFHHYPSVPMNNAPVAARPAYPGYSYRSYIERQSRRYPVMIYTLLHCVPCNRAKHLLATTYPDVQSHYLELVGNEDWQRQLQVDLHQMTGQITFPYIFVCGEFIGGASNMFDMHKSGQLRTVLNNCNPRQ